ncbi:MAG: TIGR03960 family B12-binding radical SAM protein [Thermodesulfovibrionales bacterium]
MNLLSFQKPSRYINSELNSIHKKAPVKVALAFPDVYEIGMSHLGLKILYDIINKLPFASAERVFAPWTDLEEEMIHNKTLLSSLESRLPLRDFDIVGFSLQYELAYTTVLNMLSLGGIPIKSEERLGKKAGPLVIAGGPCTLNPLPMSPFIDAFFIGDAEEAVKEILDIYLGWKDGGRQGKDRLLKDLSGIEGVFVPSLGKSKKTVRRIIPSLEDAPFPERPVLPYTNIVHDRVNIEIARGCSMGCRFCQAGMAYRPVRERSPRKVLELAENSLKNTGYEDVSFTSLSSGDYSCLHSLLKEFNRKFGGRRISISLPSLRVASVNSDILREIRAVRKTGFTIAPEAGTERLRSVINKDFSEETYLKALEALFREGWHNLKLYFMSGLPTETEEDITAIPEMVLQAIKISKKLTGRHVNISVGVSSFIPKPHTPFQWFGQDPLEVLREKNNYLKKYLLKKGVKYKGHNEEMSLLEAVLARGDESVSALIEAAWRAGCRLDAWTEVFDFDKWKKAMDISGINASEFAERTYPLESPLPWENIRTGVTKEYLIREYQNALSGNFTADCRKSCHGCGLKCAEEKTADGPAENSGGKEPSEGVREKLPARPYMNRIQSLGDEPVRIRVEYSKTGNARYLSHLELMTAIVRALRRAGFQLKYSGGFHPSPKVALGPALGVGIAGLKEYLDIEMTPPFSKESFLETLNGVLPEGIRANKIVLLDKREKSLNSFVVRYIYEIKSAKGLHGSGFSERKEILVERKEELVDIKKMVEEAERLDENTFRLTVRDQGELKVRLGELMPALFGVPAEELDITRSAVFGWNGTWSEPIESEGIWAARS